MGKMKRICSGILAMSLLVLGGGTYAYSDEVKIKSETEIPIYEVSETMEKRFKQELEEKGLDESDLTKREEIYIEVVDKSKFEEEDLIKYKNSKDKFSEDENNIVLKRTKSEYLKSMDSKNNKNGEISTYSIIGVNSPKSTTWMRLSLEVYRLSSSRYELYSFWQWLTHPNITMTDANNIHWTSNLISEYNASNSYYEFTRLNTSTGNYDRVPTIMPSSVAENAKGVNQIFNLRTLNKGRHMGYLNTKVKFRETTSNLQEAKIFTQYGHSQASLSIGFDPLGGISFGIQSSADIFNGPNAQINNR